MPPVFARAVKESEDCRAEVLAKADFFDLVDANAASYDSASQRPSMANFSTSIFYKANVTTTDSTPA